MSGATTKEIFLIFSNLGLIGGIGGIMFANSTVSNYNKQTKKLKVKKKTEILKLKNVLIAGHNKVNMIKATNKLANSLSFIVDPISISYTGFLSSFCSSVIIILQGSF